MKTPVSLLELANLALESQQNGEHHAHLAAQGDAISSAQMTALEKAALVDESYRSALDDLAESREATFVDPFARAGYFRYRIEQLFDEERPDPEKVLQTFFSARAKTMFVRGEKELEPRPAIPLFKSLRDKNEARKFTLRPLPITMSWKRKGGGQEHMGSNGVEFIVPMTPGDNECFMQMKALMARMPEVLVEHFATLTNYDVRDAVWLGLHFMPQARVLTAQVAKRLFDMETDTPTQKGSGREFVRYDLSPDEIFLMEKSEVAERFIDQLNVFAEAMRTMLAQKHKKKA